MASLGEAILNLSADYSKLKKDIEAAGNHALGKINKFGKKMQTVGRNMTVGLTLPLLGAGSFVVNAASDLKESANAVNVVYGESASILDDFGDSAAENVGLAKSEFNQLSAVTGAFLKNLGYDQAGAAEETIHLTERASDMASIFNTEVSQALEAIQSGLKGEFNPLEQFGVKLNMAAIENKALAMGLAESKEELDDNAKAQAALALIYEQTNQFAGDFRNTSDGLANSTRIMSAQLKDAAAGLGQQLLPYVLQAVQFFGDLIAKFEGLSPEQQKMILMVLGAVAVIGPLLVIIGSLISAISAIIPVIGAVAGVLSFPLIAIIALVGAAIFLLYKAWTENWGGIRDKLQLVWDFIQPVLQMIWDWLQVNIPLALQTLADFWTNVLLPAIMAVWDWIKTTLFPLFEAVANFLGAVFGVTLTALAGIWQNVLAPALQAVWEWLSEKLQPAFQVLSDFWTNVLQPILQKIAEWIGEKVAGAFQTLTDRISAVTDWLNEMADLLRNMSLPDWMTPGSPTPWEIGLLGVDDALSKLSNASLPSLSSSLGAMPSPAISGQQLALSGGGQVVFNYSPMLSTADAFEANRVLGPFIERKMRELDKR